MPESTPEPVSSTSNDPSNLDMAIDWVTIVCGLAAGVVLVYCSLALMRDSLFGSDHDA